ncbi:hypothetical protein EUX98_g9290 [Antrodiella citrinella]|uniref:Uncharacterized protein n=1 Tax=Antrodiella citrinella TaxID=2447956 RepID=A0A4S4LVP0_9APHY|nr:hypothetical protein EUX98_g9290 [Antrodiella citrinella]
MKILNHLSAILARGRGENPDSVVAVFAPELSSGDNQLTIVESVRNMDTDDAGEIQAGDPPLPSSGKDVEGKDGGFPKYVEACLHGLRLCAQLKRRGDRELEYYHQDALFEFLVRQSRIKISRKRTAIWNYYFGIGPNDPPHPPPNDPPPPPGLCAWKPQTGSDDIEFVFRPTPQIEDIISNVPRFSNVRRQRTDGESGSEYPIQGTTILAFADALVGAMQLMETALKSSNLVDVCGYLVTIYDLLKAFPRQFWENKSLQKLLEDIHRYKALVSPNEARELEHESVTLDSDLDSHIADFPEPCRRFLRTFASLTVIYFGTQFLVKRTIFRSEVPFKVHVFRLKSPVPGQSDISTQITKVVELWEAAGLIEKDVISQLDVGALKTMGGACHCEAIIMASIYPGAATNAPREIRDVFTPY